nr:methyl-accepting chemotaxis protein [Ardenticatenales bacterium]
MKLNLRPKIVSRFLIIVALMIALGASVLIQINSIHNEMVLASTNIYPSIKIQGGIIRSMHSYRTHLYRHVLLSVEEHAGIEAQLAEEVAAVKTLFGAHQPLILNPLDQSFLDRGQGDWENYLLLSEEVLSLSREQERQEALDLLFGNANETAFNQAVNDIEDWITYNDVLTAESLAKSEQTYLTAQRLVAGFLLGTVFVALVVGLYLAENIARGTQQMVQSAEQIAQVDLRALAAATTAMAEGDLTQFVEIQTPPVTYQSGDEIGALALAFNQMLASLKQSATAFNDMSATLRELILEVQENAVTVATTSEQISANVEQTGNASQRISQIIQQVTVGAARQTLAVTGAKSNIEQVARAAEGIARGAQEQAMGVQRTSLLVGEMAEMVNQVGEVARAVTGASGQVTQAARAGVRAVEQSNLGMGQIQARTVQATARVKEMGARTAEIGRIVEVIDDIADKTDMLALNAAVEAARAGEHGRGFAVVADQVRKLSEDAKSATRDIGQLIGRVNEAVREVVAAMEGSAAEVESGTRQTGEVTRSLEEILRAAEESATLAAQITGSVEQVRRRSEGVLSAIESVSAVVEENTASAEEMAASSREVTEGMEGVADVAEENSGA